MREHFGEFEAGQRRRRHGWADLRPVHGFKSVGKPLDGLVAPKSEPEVVGSLGVVGDAWQAGDESRIRARACPGPPPNVGPITQKHEATWRDLDVMVGTDRL